MLIDVARRLVAAGDVERGERLATVERLRNRQARDVDRPVVGRIDAQLAEIHRTRVALRHLRPRLAAILGSEDAAALDVHCGRRPAGRRLRRSLAASAAAATAAASGLISARRAAVVAPVERRTAASPLRALRFGGQAPRFCRASGTRPTRRTCPWSACATRPTCPWSACAACPSSWRNDSRGTGRRVLRRRARFRGSRSHRRTGLARFDLRVHDFRIRSRHIERDAAPRAGRQPEVARQFRPRLARVGRLPDRAARTAAVEAAAAAAALIARRVQNVAVRRIDRNVVEARILVDELHLRPVLPAVDRLVDAAVRIRSEQVSRRCDVHGLRVLRIDDDPRDRLRLLEPRVREGPAAVGRLVNAVAEGRRLAVVRLARSDVHDARIRRMDRDVADRRRAVAFEHRLERRPVILRLEDAADGVADVDDVRVALGHGNVVDAPAHARRSDRAEPESRQQRVVGLVDWLSRGGARALAERRDAEQRRGEQQRGQRNTCGATKIQGDGHDGSLTEGCDSIATPPTPPTRPG